MAIETPLWLDPKPGEDQGPPTSARQDRAIIAALFTEGVADLQGGDLLVTQRASGATMDVEIAPGAVYVAGDDVARQGTYRDVVTSTEVRHIEGAPGSGARIDLVVFKIRDPASAGGTQQGGFIEVVPGASATTPVAPDVPPTAVVLAEVRVAAGQALVTNADITDRRRQSGANTLKVGVQIQPMSTAERDALTLDELYAGHAILNTTTGRLEAYSGSAWVGVGSVQRQVFTASGTWTKPEGAKQVDVVVMGGGGGGGGAVRPSGGDFVIGGSGGGRLAATIPTSALPASVPVVVGAGGVAAENGGSGTAPSGAGGFSRFGDYYASGGDGGGVTGAVPRRPGIANSPASISATPAVNSGAARWDLLANPGPGATALQGASDPANPGVFGPSSPRGAGAGGGLTYDNSFNVTVYPAGLGMSASWFAFGTLPSVTNRPGGEGGTTGRDAASKSGTGLCGDGGGPVSNFSQNQDVRGGAGGIPGGGGGGALVVADNSTVHGGAGGRGEVIVTTYF